MISHKYKCIFIHCQRTGGNSIELALEGISLLDKNLEPTELWDNSLHRGVTKYKIDNRGHYMHDSASELRVECEEFNNYFKFSFVRNPWARMASWYRLRREYADQTGRGIDAVNAGFKEWLISITQGNTIAIQTGMLYDDNDQCLVDFIGRFENLQQDFNFVCDKIKIPHRKLTHSNASSLFFTSYREQYNDWTKNFVEEYFSKDIKNFGYQF